MFFAWSGSGQDSLTFEVSKGSPADEVVFLLFAGVSADAVRRAGERAEIPVDRIRRSIAAHERSVTLQ